MNVGYSQVSLSVRISLVPLRKLLKVCVGAGWDLVKNYAYIKKRTRKEKLMLERTSFVKK